MLKTNKPYTRWWWFAGKITREDITYQLDWIKANNFAGVEIAWVYPKGQKESAPQWLGEVWQKLVQHTWLECKRIGLGCDFTFGTFWPFGGTLVTQEDSSQTFFGPSLQRLDRSWEMAYNPEPGLILNHLDSQALARYAKPILSALKKQLNDTEAGNKTSLFCDSWEVLTKDLWNSDLDEMFQSRFNYALEPYKRNLDDFPDVRYDYRKLISDILYERFYLSFHQICTENGALSRVQCHGAPTELVRAYGSVDIPETETLLFDPDFSLFAASAAALQNKRIVSSETFTCLYGWEPIPGEITKLKKEQILDLKLIADAQFAWGVNQVIWHGKPYSTPENPQEFYASVFVGEEGTLSKYIASFNLYLEKISAIMKKGETLSLLTILVPWEDNLCKGELPKPLKKPSSEFYWEMQECKLPESLLPWRPIWFAPSYLQETIVREGQLYYKDRNLKAIYVESQWLDRDSLVELTRLADSGGIIIMRKRPNEPGKITSDDYSDLVDKVLQKAVTESNFMEKNPSLLSCDIPVDFWCRKEGDIIYLFISNPNARNLRYPLEWGMGNNCTPTAPLIGEFQWESQKWSLKLDFQETDSILFTLNKNGYVYREICSYPFGT